MEDMNIRLGLKVDMTLRGVNLTAEWASLSIILGAVGTGKLTLLRAILGETTNEDGLLSVLDAWMSYCG